MAASPHVKTPCKQRKSPAEGVEKLCHLRLAKPGSHWLGMPKQLNRAEQRMNPSAALPGVAMAVLMLLLSSSEASDEVVHLTVWTST